MILYSASAPTTLTFLLRPAGLVPVAENGVIRYQDKDTGETVLTTSPFYIYDSAETPHGYIDTDFSLEELTGGIYMLTVTLDAAYLATEGLTYPIYVDPSVYYASTGDVETTAVYSGSTMLNQPCGNELYHYVGYREMPYSQGRMLVRLNALKDNVLFRSLSADQVTSVTLNLMSAGGGGSSSTVIMAYQFTGADSWTPTGATFSGVQASSYALPYCGTTMAPDDSVCSLNVTSIAEGWLGFTEEATTKASQGIILLNSNSVYPEFSRCFYGSQSFTGVLPTVTVTYTPTIQDGTYYIRNSATETYMKKGGTTEGSSVLTDSFDVDESKWIVTLQSTGYYTIKSASCDLYLGIAAGDSTGTSSVRLNDTTGRSSQWAILPMANGNYVLMANPVASNSNGVITRALGVTEADSEVGQYAKSNDENEKKYEEWELYTYHYTLNIEVMYEEAFADRFSNPISQITNAMAVTQDKFLTEFGILIKYSAPVEFKSLADECNDTMNPDIIPQGMEKYEMGCPHFDENECMNSYIDTLYEAHHKNVYNIVFAEDEPDISVSTKIYFLGNEICSADNHESSPNGLSWKQLGIIAISNYGSSNDDFNRTVLHEIGHWYYAPDHYNINCPSTDDKNDGLPEDIYSSDCIYGENKSRSWVLEDMEICEGCRREILKKVSRFNHE